MSKMENSWTPDVYNDIPVAYVVYKVLFAEDGETVKNTQYVYANRLYCEMAGKSQAELVGSLFLSSYDKADPHWLTYCEQAIKTGRPVHDSIYAQEIQHWLDFTVMPLAKPGYVAYTFMNIDADRAYKMNMERRDASQKAILNISKILNNDEEYETSMNHALQELSRVIHPDRLYILETDGKTVSNTFEWCAEGITPEIDTLQDLDYEEYIGGWEKFLKDSPNVLIEDIETLKEDDPVDYYNLKRQGIKRILDVPFYHDGRLIGYLGADNYEVSDLINTADILETVSYFIASKITNHSLMTELERLSRYDSLTGLHNRNALTEKMDAMQQCTYSVGVVYADLNGLKEINDNFSHGAGDRALQRAAAILTECYGVENTYRAGGDEFVVLVPLITKIDFQSSLSRLREKLQQEKEISVAVGGHWIADSTKLNEALRVTDCRMYHDKVEYYNRRDKGTGHRAARHAQPLRLVDKA
ncbi:GGDEF domain-containing protein [Mitsuokella sp. WILCCON 0060]|uniref:GGDEF domain-containing protein n=1 Tax=Mitsuokella sp. WILCCON 0060 TaxID=3345341 RepID=UPI003F1C5461